MHRLESLLPRGTPCRRTLTLPFEQRSKSRLRARLDDGEEAAIVLPRGRVLRGGDVLGAHDGIAVRIEAALEEVSTAFADDATVLARAAYHLGNRHVAVEVGTGWVRYLHDHVLDELVRSLGAELRCERAPFEPEGGAYGDRHERAAHHHDHHHGDVDSARPSMGEEGERSVATATPSRLALLRLASQALPVGGFSYSRGLEGAVAAGWVHDEATVGAWVLDVLEHALCPLDGAVLWRLHRAWRAGDGVAVRRWTIFLRASRESGELLFEDEQMGRALARLLDDLGVASTGARTFAPASPAAPGDAPASFVCEFARAAARWGLSAEDALLGFFWSAVEGQVGAALRLLPLGQTAGQRILERAVDPIARAVTRVPRIEDDEVGGFTAGLALVSAWHESQYSRLFRS